ncbi:glycosyltransferase family 2 protein [Methyloceanibacter sp.]|uniref:glycosyltransferase family 2 protein n=1 Tax=Methyloceanibacter sp. TaxID=1965321 RepID=UPI002C264560|nr:glycosyltransferase family 2 protein [Methyloceanibacter sp.]HML91679.1 glycosyltransferase family 2 protein [Methyloceanibacter sp.]
MPSISIITPSYNQVAFVEKMLKSIVEQSVVPLEHIIFDGGSTDGTLDILQDFAGQHAFARLHVGEDQGQIDAINRGFALATGDVVTWLNTDDWYAAPDVLARVLETFDANPEIDIVYGRGNFVDEHGALLREAFINTQSHRLRERFIVSNGILQPSLFMRRSFAAELGPLNERFGYCFDFEYWIRAAMHGASFFFLDQVLSEATLHRDSKTMGQRADSLKQTADMLKDQYGFVCTEWLRRIADSQATGADGIVSQSPDLKHRYAQRVGELFHEFNGGPSQIAALLDFAGSPECAETLADLKNYFRRYGAFFVVPADSKSLESSMEALSALQQTSSKPFAVFIPSCGTFHLDRRLGADLDNVYALRAPVAANNLSDSIDLESGLKKIYFAKCLGEILYGGAPVLWIEPLKKSNMDVASALNLLDTKEALTLGGDSRFHCSLDDFDSGDSDEESASEGAERAPATPAAYANLGGFKVGGKLHPLIDQAYAASWRGAPLSGNTELAPIQQNAPDAACDHHTRSRAGVLLRRLAGVFGKFND